MEAFGLLSAAMMDLERRSSPNFIQITLNLNVALSFSCEYCNLNTSGKEWIREALGTMSKWNP